MGWGVLFAYLADFIAVDKNFGTAGATTGTTCGCKLDVYTTVLFWPFFPFLLSHADELTDCPSRPLTPILTQLVYPRLMTTFCVVINFD